MLLSEFLGPKMTAWFVWLERELGILPRRNFRVGDSRTEETKTISFDLDLELVQLVLPLKQEQTLFNDLRQGPFKGNKKDLCIKEGVPLYSEIIVGKERVVQW